MTFLVEVKKNNNKKTTCKKNKKQVSKVKLTNDTSQIRTTWRKPIIHEEGQD